MRSLTVRAAAKRLALVGAAVGVVAGGALLAAPAAQANSFATNCGNRTSFNYYDYVDGFTINANATGATISAKLSPVKAGRGPSVTVSTTAGRGGHMGKTASLSRAYEDSQYRYTVTCTTSAGKKVTKTGTFWS